MKALGRIKGGLNTKLHILTDSERANVTHAPSLMQNASGTHALMDCAFDSDALRALNQQGLHG